MPADAFQNSRSMTYVGRPTVWGNPYEISKKLNRRQVIDAFYTYALLRLHEEPDWLAPLRQKHLSCWCLNDDPVTHLREGKACHAQILRALANGWWPLDGAHVLVWEGDTLVDDLPDGAEAPVPLAPPQ